MAVGKPTVGSRRARPAGPMPPTTVALTPKEVLGILRRHLLLIIILTALGLGLGGGTWYLLRQYLPKYTAQTFVKVLPPVETDPMDIVAAQVHKDIQYQHRLSMANLIKQQRALQELLRNDKVRRTRWFERRDRDDRKAFKYLKRHLGAYAHRDAEFVEISMTCRDAEEAALIVNEMAQWFVASQQDTTKTEVGERLRQLEERKNSVQRELNAAEAALEDVRKASGITDLERPATGYWRHTFEMKLDDLELQENELLLAIKQTEADIANLRELAEGPITVQIDQAIETEHVMVMLAEQLAFQEAQLAGRLTRFGENHRVVRQTQQLIDEIKQERKRRQEIIAEQTRQAGLENAQDRLAVLQQRLAELQNLRAEAAAKKKKLDLARVQYEQRLKIRDERIEMLDAVKSQIEKLRIMLNDPKTPTVQLVGLAPAPLEMVTSRQWWLWLPGGTIVGLLLGVGLAFLIETANDLVRTPRDVARFLDVPLLCMIPDAVEDKLDRDVDLALTVYQAPYSVISECYRQLRANFELSSSAESWKTILVTSGNAADGKTSVAVNLATTFVAKNQKVLLLDANFRRPGLQEIFAKTQAHDFDAQLSNLGLSSLLTDQCGYEVIRPSGIQGLDIIVSGPMPSNPAELLASARMQELIKEQRKIYDYIIVDSPPVLLVSDAKVLAKLVDATILVLNAAATSRGAAQRAIGELRAVGASVVGCVLFAVRAMKGGYFHEQFKSYRKYQGLQLAGAR
ncbi:MAG: polysaccharide biosynthesis tyrosine autokinase [Sedimentisphaerales bacterium]